MSLNSDQAKSETFLIPSPPSSLSSHLIFIQYTFPLTSFNQMVKGAVTLSKWPQAKASLNETKLHSLIASSHSTFFFLLSDSS